MSDKNENRPTEAKEEETETETQPEESQGGEVVDAKSDTKTDGEKDEKDAEEEDNIEEDEDDDVMTGDPEYFTAVDRNNLFEQGVNFQKNGKKRKALNCFLASIKSLSDTNGFTFLPQSLRKIADLYYDLGEYDKAIQFIQAEKMYYETAIIDTSTLQRKLENEQLLSDLDEESSTKEMTSEKTEVVRAKEYENLARMCLDKQQPQLALEYQGKATKLRQQIFGDDHPVTAKSLDFFTVVYAEVGKQQYSESMNKVDVENIGKMTSDAELRNRKPGAQEKEDDATELEKQIERREREEQISRIILWVFFMACFVILGIILFYIYCKVDVNSRSCAAWRSDVYYYYMRFKYFFYSTFMPKKQ